MSSLKRRYLSVSLILTLAVLSAAYAWQSGFIDDLLQDRRLRNVSVDDFVHVRRMQEGIRLDIYSGSDSSAYTDDFRAFLQTLPRIRQINGDVLKLQNPAGDSGKTVDLGDVADLNFIRARDVSWTAEDVQATFLSEVEFERFGEIDFGLMSRVVAKVLAADQPVTSAFLDSAAGRTGLEYVRDNFRIRRAAIALYQRSTSDAEAVQQLFTQFMQFEFNADTLNDPARNEQRLKLARRVLQKSRDPIAVMHTAYVEREFGEHDDGADRLHDALRRLSPDRFGTERFFGRIEQLSSRRPHAFISTEQHRDAMDQFVQECTLPFTDPNYNPNNLRFIAWMYLKGWLQLDDARREEAVKQLLKSSNVPEWMAHYSAALYHYHFGWRFRGSSLIHEVPDADLERFGDELALASFHALRALELRPDIPYPTALLVNMARTNAVPIGPPRAYFVHGMKTQVDFSELFEGYLISLQSKWGGSNQQVLEYAGACAGSKRFDTLIPYFALSAVRKFDGGSMEASEVTKLPAIQHILQDLTNSIPKASKDPEVRWRADNALLHIAARSTYADNLPLARAAFEKVSDPELNSSWFHHYRLGNVKTVRRRVFMKTEPNTQPMSALEAGTGFTFDAGPNPDFAVLRKQIEQRLAEHRNIFVREYHRQAADITDLYEQFYRKQNVELPFDADHFVWQPHNSNLAFSEQAQLTIPKDFRAPNTIAAELRPRFPIPFEVRVIFDIDPDYTAGHSASLIIGDEDRFKTHQADWGTVIFASPQTFGMLAIQPGREPQVLGNSTFVSSNELRARVYADRIDLQLNGTDLESVVRTAESRRAVIAIGFANDSRTLNTDLTFHSVKIRKLSDTPSQ